MASFVFLTVVPPPFFFVKIVLERMCRQERYRNGEQKEKEKERGYTTTGEK
jgi:hypothetical protein